MISEAALPICQTLDFATLLLRDATWAIVGQSVISRSGWLGIVLEVTGARLGRQHR
jgi:hypothetical protein